MRILSYMHHLEVGGTQTNAIDLAVMLREMHGWETVAFAAPGPMARVLVNSGIPYIQAPEDGQPRSAIARSFWEAISQVKPDLVHAWDWWQYINAMTPALLAGTPLIVSDMISDDSFRVIPRWQMTTFGTAQMLDRAVAGGHRWAAELRPPVDTRSNRPGVVDGSAFRSRFRILPKESLVVSVSRLAPLKEESIVRTMDVVGALSDMYPVKYVIVGAGESLPRLHAHACRVNSLNQREAVLFAGEMTDPRVAYQAADLVVGMGGSALKGMAFEKPVVVVGKNGFARAAQSPDDSHFLYHGLYGLGDGDPGNEDFRALIESLLSRRNFSATVASSCRILAERHFGLQGVARSLASYYGSVVAQQVPTERRLDDLLRMVVALRPDQTLYRRVASVLRARRPDSRRVRRQGP